LSGENVWANENVQVAVTVLLKRNLFVFSKEFILMYKLFETEEMSLLIGWHIDHFVPLLTEHKEKEIFEQLSKAPCDLLKAIRKSSEFEYLKNVCFH
jgi:hypothetical protein